MTDENVVEVDPTADTRNDDDRVEVDLWIRNVVISSISSINRHLLAVLMIHQAVCHMLALQPQQQQLRRPHCHPPLLFHPANTKAAAVAVVVVRDIEDIEICISFSC